MSKLVGVIYPGIETIKYLENKANKDPLQFRHWLTYWALFAITTALDDYEDAIMTAIPLYHFGKALLFIWAFHPLTEGATILYKSIVNPVFRKYRVYIEMIAAFNQKLQ